MNAKIISHPRDQDNAVQAERRAFLKKSALLTALISSATLQTLASHAAWAQGNPGRRGACSAHGLGYGPLHPVKDQNGLEILALPAGFSYVTFSRIGAPLSNGRDRTPRNLDGMGAFTGPNGTVRLIRNHEVRNRPGDMSAAVGGPADLKYDALASGGTVTVDYDPALRRVVREFVSLNGTMVNCSGGLAYGNQGWLSCEETVDGPAKGYGQKHGYVFFVPASADAAIKAEPLKAMGRFAHEAAFADRDTGIVYLTEDAGSNSGFYRFIPHNPNDLLAGGELQMLKVAGRPQYDSRENQRVGNALPVEWVTIGTPDPDLESGQPSVFQQGFAGGAARFNRLEGVYQGLDGSLFFTATSGGNAKNGDFGFDGYQEGYGQIWRYIPNQAGTGVLVLAFESSGGSVLDSPDNLCVSPRGGLLLCEDDAGARDGARDTHPLAPGITNVNRLVGLTTDGVPFEFAVNRFNDSELAGACFSPDGRILFVNIFGDGAPGSGMTCAIAGPWQAGPL